MKRLEDVEELRELKARYCSYSDGGWAENGPSHAGPFSSLFVEDGIWDGRPRGVFAQGREQIEELVVPGGETPFVMHLVTNGEFEIDSDTATATASWNAVCPIESLDGAARWIISRYDEEYLRTDEGWRYTRCKFATARSSVQESGWTVHRAEEPPD